MKAAQRSFTVKDVKMLDYAFQFVLSHVGQCIGADLEYYRSSVATHIGLCPLRLKRKLLLRDVCLDACCTFKPII